MVKPTGLGRGFDSLIPSAPIEKKYDTTATPSEGVEEVSVSLISPNPHQPRTQFDESSLKELAVSIKKHGVIQPLVVQKKGSRYELLAGERRLRASKLAGLGKVPVVVRSYTTQQQLELAIIENVQREDLNSIEIATSYQKLIDQFNFTNDKVAKSVGKHVSTVKNIIRLLGLPKEAKEALVSGAITEGHARAILSVGDLSLQKKLLEHIIEHKLSVAQTESYAKSLKETGATVEQASQAKADETPQTKRLGKILDTRVTLKHMAKGGRLVIEYATDDDLQRILNYLEKKS